MTGRCLENVKAFLVAWRQYMQRENWLLSGKDWKKLADCCQDSQSLQAGQASTILLMERN